MSHMSYLGLSSMLKNGKIYEFGSFWESSIFNWLFNDI